jgi:rhamnosyltransferase
MENEKPDNNPIISIIIRAKNEEKYLKQVLEIIKQQTFQNFEIILVDDRSIDKTVEIAKNYNSKIVTIPKGKFSHPYSCNLGAECAKGKYLVYLNGHSIPLSKKFLENGLKNFIDEKVAGVYAYNLAHKDGTLADKILYDIAGLTVGMIRFEAKGFEPGILGTTNAILRKDLWEKYNFNLNINDGWGGEDTDWSRHFMALGYKIIHDPKFTVRHSHHLKLKDLFWQINNWRKMSASKGTPEKQRKNF